eukprot:scaffold7381_cov310-Pinguiococcus_pyrenoidosus.AAC.122
MHRVVPPAHAVLRPTAYGRDLNRALATSLHDDPLPPTTHAAWAHREPRVGADLRRQHGRQDRRDHRLVLEVEHRPRLARQLPRVQLNDHGLVRAHLEEATLAVGGCYVVAHGKGLLGQGGLLEEAVHRRAVRQLPAVQRHLHDARGANVHDDAGAVDRGFGCSRRRWHDRRGDGDGRREGRHHGGVLKVQHRPGSARELPRLQADHYRLVRAEVDDVAGPVRRRDQVADGKDRLDQSGCLDEAVDGGVLRKLPALERDLEDAISADADNAAAAVDGVDGFSDPPVAQEAGAGLHRLRRGGSTGFRRPSDVRDHGDVLEVEHRAGAAGKLPGVEADYHRLVRAQVHELAAAVGGRDFVADCEGHLLQGGLLHEAVDGGILGELPAVQGHLHDAAAPDLHDGPDAVDGLDALVDHPEALQAGAAVHGLARRRVELVAAGKQRDHLHAPQVQHGPRVAGELPGLQTHDHGSVRAARHQMALAVAGCHLIAHADLRLAQRAALQEAVHSGVLRKLPALQGDLHRSVRPEARDDAGAVDGVHVLAQAPEALVGGDLLRKVGLVGRATVAIGLRHAGGAAIAKDCILKSARLLRHGGLEGAEAALQRLGAKSSRGGQGHVHHCVGEALAPRQVSRTWIRSASKKATKTRRSHARRSAGAWRSRSPAPQLRAGRLASTYLGSPWELPFRRSCASMGREWLDRLPTLRERRTPNISDLGKHVPWEVGQMEDGEADC